MKFFGPQFWKIVNGVLKPITSSIPIEIPGSVTIGDTLAVSDASPGSWARKHTDFEVPGGFTNTGIAYDPQWDTLWVCDYTNNQVKMLGKSGAINTSKTFSVAGSNGLQGIAYDTSDNTLWITRGDQIYNYSKAGALIDTVATLAGNVLSAALAYMPHNDRLIVGKNESNVLTLISCADGSAVGTITCADMAADGGVDGVAYDYLDGTLWATKNGDPSIYHLTTGGVTIATFANPDPGDQAEGITIDTKLGILWYSADGEFHAAIPDGNRIWPLYGIR